MLRIKILFFSSLSSLSFSAKFFSVILIFNTFFSCTSEIGLDRSKSTHKSMKSQARAESVELKTGGLPDALTDSPQIAAMTDDSLTLVWSPSIPEKARFPVSYVIEFGKARDGVWMIYQDSKFLFSLVFIYSTISSFL